MPRHSFAATIALAFVALLSAPLPCLVVAQTRRVRCADQNASFTTGTHAIQ